MRDSATQIEDQIDKTRNALHQNKMGLARLKGQINRVDSKDPSYVSYFKQLCLAIYVASTFKKIPLRKTNTYTWNVH